jgi:hypothetical protein
VRDPRNVVLSSSNHNNQSHERHTEDLIIGRELRPEGKENIKVYTGTWGGNFNSWKSFKSVNKYFLVHYEDLIKEKDKIFYEILKFIHNLKNIEFVLDKKKFKNVLDSTDFGKVQKLESKKGFDESMTDKNTGKKIKFFNLGSKTNWQSGLEPNLQNKIEEVFEKEMKELNYL